MEAGLSVRVQKVLNRLRTSVVELCKSQFDGVYRGLIEQNEEYNRTLESGQRKAKIRKGT